MGSFGLPEVEIIAIILVLKFYVARDQALLSVLNKVKKVLLVQPDVSDDHKVVQNNSPLFYYF
jgi:hypothetical protein